MWLAIDATINASKLRQTMNSLLLICIYIEVVVSDVTDGGISISPRILLVFVDEVNIICEVLDLINNVDMWGSAAERHYGGYY